MIRFFKGTKVQIFSLKVYLIVQCNRHKAIYYNKYKFKKLNEYHPKFLFVDHISITNKVC